MLRQTLRELVRVSWPMMASQGAFAVMMFTDRWFMSRIDAAHIAASMGGGLAFFFCISFFMGIIAYANALVAQYYGARDLGKCSLVITQGMLMALGCLPVLAIAAWYIGMMFAGMGHAQEQVVLERQYFFALVAGSFFVLAKTCLVCFFAGTGRTKIVMVAELVGVAVNIPLTWMLVFGHLGLGLPQMGIVGAAVGTIVSNIVAVALLLMVYTSRAYRQRYELASSLRFHGGVFRRYVRLGLPSGIETFLNIATFNLFLLMFQAYGVTEGAAIAIVFNWDMLCFIPMTGINVGVMTMIGRAVGARDMRRANHVIFSGFAVALTYSALLGLLFVTLRTRLIDVFATPEPGFAAIRELASYMMIGLSTYVMADATTLVAGGVLRGAGDTRWLMVTSVSVHIVMLLIQYVIIMVLDLGPKISWWVFVASILALAAVYLIRLAGDVWRHPSRLDRVMQD